jgi:hypothetical protein
VIQYLLEGIQIITSNSPPVLYRVVSRPLPGFRDPCIHMHINTDCACISAFPFMDLMQEIHQLFLGKLIFIANS